MDHNERYRLHEEWINKNSDSYSARVRKAYLEPGHKLTDLTVKQLVRGSLRIVLLEDHEDYVMGELESLNTNARHEFESRLPYLLDVIFENPFFREVIIPMKHLTEEFVTKSVLIPETVVVSISCEKGEKVDTLELITKFTGVQNLSIGLYFDDRMGEILSELPNLKHLSLMSDRITQFPIFLLDMRLKTLDLSCEISNIPGEIVNMKDLEHLSISSFNLTDLPAEILDIPKLSLLRINGTRINDIRILGEMPELIVAVSLEWPPKYIPENYDLEGMGKRYSESSKNIYGNNHLKKIL